MDIYLMYGYLFDAISNRANSHSRNSSKETYSICVWIYVNIYMYSSHKSSYIYIQIVVYVDMFIYVRMCT